MLNSRYELIKECGKGAFSTVYLANDVLKNNHVAIKVLPYNQLSEDEVEISSKLRNSENLVTLLDNFNIKDKHYLVFERGYPVFKDYLSHNLSNTSVLSKIFYDSLNGCKNMHNHGFLHLDIHPLNILKVNNSYCLSDFGCSTNIGLNDNIQITRKGGTWEYMPPETFGDIISVSRKSDVYFMGSLGIFLFTGKPPVYSSREFKSSKFYKQECIKQHLKIFNPSVADEKLKQALIISTHPDPSKRFNSLEDFIDFLK